MNNHTSSNINRWVWDILALVILFAVGYSALRFLFTTDPFVYDDHGFHFATLNYVLTKSIPVHYRFIDWNPNWFAGIPELQFYPPGFAFLGAILYYLAFTTLTPGTIYQIVLISTLFLPAITGYFLLRKIEFPWWVGLISGLFLLTYAETDSGILFGVIVGLINSRFALGLFFLIMIFFLYCLERSTRRLPWILLAFSVALVILFHPYHSFLPFLGIAAQLYTWSRIGINVSSKETRKLFFILILGVGLVSFWWIPLFFHTGYVSQMQVWSGSNKFKDLLYALSEGWSKKLFLVLYCISALSLLYGNHTEKRKAILAGLLLTPVFMLVFLLIIRLVLNSLLRNYMIDPWRLQDDFHFSIILTSGIGIGLLIEKFIEYMRNWKLREFNKLMATGLLLILISVGYFSVDIMSHCFHYSGFSQFASLHQTKRILLLDELWNYLKTDSEGRILFTSSRVGYPNLPSRFVTHAIALTPDYTGRSILGAVNEPFYSTASFLYFGVKPPNIVREEADFLQNESLFGIPWEKMSADTFWNFCRRYNVTTIITNIEETKVNDFLSHSEKFIPVPKIGVFNLYHLNNYSSSWLLSDNNSVEAEIVKFTDDQITIRVKKSLKDSLLFVKMGYYPRWKAYIGIKQIPLKSDEMGLMRLQLSEGHDYSISIRYESTLAEKMGWSLTFLSVVLLITISIIPNRKHT